MVAWNLAKVHARVRFPSSAPFSNDASSLLHTYVSGQAVADFALEPTSRDSVGLVWTPGVHWVLLGWPLGGVESPKLSFVGSIPTQPAIWYSTVPHGSVHQTVANNR